MTRLPRRVWEKLLVRWCPMEATPEVNLVVWLLASAIADEPGEAARGGRKPFKGGFFDGRFNAWCRAVGLNPRFVLEQIDVAARARVQMTSGGRQAMHG